MEFLGILLSSKTWVSSKMKCSQKIQIDIKLLEYMNWYYHSYSFSLFFLLLHTKVLLCFVIYFFWFVCYILNCFFFFICYIISFLSSYFSYYLYNSKNLLVAIGVNPLIRSSKSLEKADFISLVQKTLFGYMNWFLETTLFLPPNLFTFEIMIDCI